MDMAAILVMWPDHLNNLSFPHPTEDLYEIWIWLAQWFLGRRCLKIVDDEGQKRPEAYLYYKLTIEPSAQVS